MSAARRSQIDLSQATPWHGSLYAASFSRPHTKPLASQCIAPYYQHPGGRSVAPTYVSPAHHSLVPSATITGSATGGVFHPNYLHGYVPPNVKRRSVSTIPPPQSPRHSSPPQTPRDRSLARESRGNPEWRGSRTRGGFGLGFHLRPGNLATKAPRAQNTRGRAQEGGTSPIRDYQDNFWSLF